MESGDLFIGSGDGRGRVVNAPGLPNWMIIHGICNVGTGNNLRGCKCEHKTNKLAMTMRHGLHGLELVNHVFCNLSWH